MKRIDKLAIALIVAWIIQMVSTPCLLTFLADRMHSDAYNSVTLMNTVMIYGSALLKSLTAILCGGWLYLEAKRERQNHWVWCFFGLAFGMNAVAIFYAYAILQLLRTERKRISEPEGAGYDSQARRT